MLRCCSVAPWRYRRVIASDGAAQVDRREPISAAPRPPRREDHDSAGVIATMNAARTAIRASNERSRTPFVVNFDQWGRNVSWRYTLQATDDSLTTILGFTEFPPCLLLVKLDVAVAAGENLYENFCVFEANFCWYGADVIRVCEHCASRYGKRLRWTWRLLRKSYGQWRASKLWSNDSGSSPIAIWRAGSRLSQELRHGSH
jgi:hypothetical protein